MTLRGNETRDVINDFKKTLIIVLISGIFGFLIGVILNIF